MSSVREERDLYGMLGETVEEIRRRSEVRPAIGVVLGSWLGGLAAEVEGGVAIRFDELPHFPVSSVPGRPGELRLGRIGGRSVAVLSARVHLYEGYGEREVAYPVQTLGVLGVRTLVLTNAAGGVNPAFGVGTLMLIADQINLTGRNPLEGPNDPRLGPRYPDMAEAYSAGLRRRARTVAANLGVPLAEGVYAGILGPSFETPAEVRMLRALGADAVGMSTVLEVIAARHVGMEVLGVSCITDTAGGAPPDEQSPGIPRDALDGLAALVRGFVSAHEQAGERTPPDRVVSRRK